MTTTMLAPQQLPELDYALLDRQLDRVKSKVFIGNNAAFLGRIMCSVDFIWSTEVQTAATNGAWIKWNPYYFHFLSFAGRMSILVHELWHVGLMHMLRRGERIPEIWNAAADTVLDNMMDKDGYCVDSSLFPLELFPPGCKTFVNHEKYGTMSVEEIYDDMIQNSIQPPNSGAGMDLVEPEKGSSTQHQVINTVVAATHAAKLSNAAGTLPGDLETTLEKFLSPKLPWEQLLYNFFNELSDQDYSWSRPNRRYRDVYLPSLIDDHEGLDHIIYYLDTSGSVSDGDIIRFHSEFKYVKETFKPEKMTMVLFDTQIRKEYEFEKDDPFEKTVVVGRGGTSLVCVREHIIKNEPTAVVIFSDMLVTPMEPLPAGMNVPIIWIALNAHKDTKVNQGQLVFLNE